jgi:hypothetical protein
MIKAKLDRATGNAGAAKGIGRYRSHNIPKFFRGDAAFANPAFCRLLEHEG